MHTPSGLWLRVFRLGLRETLANLKQPFLNRSMPLTSSLHSSSILSRHSQECLDSYNILKERKLHRKVRSTNLPGVINPRRSNSRRRVGDARSNSRRRVGGFEVRVCHVCLLVPLVVSIRVCRVAGMRTLRAMQRAYAVPFIHHTRPFNP